MAFQPLPIEHVEILGLIGAFEYDQSWNWDTPSRGYYHLSIGLDGARMRHFAVHWKPAKGRWTVAPEALLGVRIQEMDTAMVLLNNMLRLPAFEDKLALQQCEWLLLQVLALLWRETQEPDTGQVSREIYQHMVQIRSRAMLFWTVDELAGDVHLSRMHYTRRFKQLAGETPNRFQIKRRMEKACGLLRSTSMTLDQIASKIGYRDAFFFSRQFRREMNQSPMAYRKSESAQ